MLKMNRLSCFSMAALMVALLSSTTSSASAPSRVTCPFDFMPGAEVVILKNRKFAILKYADTSDQLINVRLKRALKISIEPNDEDPSAKSLSTYESKTLDKKRQYSLVFNEKELSAVLRMVDRRHITEFRSVCSTDSQ
jgi:hypothetical protein